MTELKKTSKLVKALMIEDEHCRNSDSYLYLKVLSTIAENKSIDLKGISVPDFLINYHGSKFPIFETVRRARQKLQEHHPELAPCEIVEEYRAENEAEYIDFARGVI